MAPLVFATLAVLLSLTAVQGQTAGEACSQGGRRRLLGVMGDICDEGYICESGTCKIMEGTSCAGNEQHCKTGAFCFSDDTGSVCKLKAGFPCIKGSNAHCLLNATCDTPQGATADECSCDAGYFPLPGHTVCVKPDCSGVQGQTAGQACSQGGRRRLLGVMGDICDEGYICESGTCKIMEGTSCAGNEQHCKTGAFCFSDDTGSVCKLKAGFPCIKGSNAHCLLNATCDTPQGATADECSCDAGLIPLPGHTVCVEPDCSGGLAVKAVFLTLMAASLLVFLLC